MSRNGIILPGHGFDGDDFANLVQRVADLEGRAITSIRGPNTARSGNTVLFTPDEDWWGIIEALGPGDESDYTDGRYWVRELYAANNSVGVPPVLPNYSDVADMKAIPNDGNSALLWITATNLAEATAGSHSLVVGTPVRVLLVSDLAGVAHYVFNTKSSTKSSIWSDCIMAGGTNGFGLIWTGADSPYWTVAAIDGSFAGTRKVKCEWAGNSTAPYSATYSTNALGYEMSFYGGAWYPRAAHGDPFKVDFQAYNTDGFGYYYGEPPPCLVEITNLDGYDSVRAKFIDPDARSALGSEFTIRRQYQAIGVRYPGYPSTGDDLVGKTLLVKPVMGAFPSTNYPCYWMECGTITRFGPDGLASVNGSIVGLPDNATIDLVAGAVGNEFHKM